MGEDTATVDVGNQDDRAVYRLGKTHVSDVARAQVDLRRTACALDHNCLVFGHQPCMGAQHGVARHALVVVVGAGIHVANDAPVNDDLCTHITVGLEQHRVEIGVGWQATRLCLHRLSATDFAAVSGYSTVQRHVLGFERRHAHVVPCQPAAQGRDQRALTGIGGGALDHQGAGGHVLA